MPEIDEMQLGGSIVLSGFKNLHRAELVVVKKIVGSYARKFSDNLDGYDSLSLSLKEIHKTEGSEKFELHAKLVHKGKVETSEVTDRNVFVAIDSVLKKLESMVF